jgi:3-dehydroquinate synthetase
MVDSSVGGKTGINIPEGKNLVGAFHQPDLVLIDLKTLETLPEREFAAGMSEVVKYGVIWDSGLFEMLEKTKLNPAADELGAVVSRCCEIKAEVVRQDEREGGLRGILNFGHTLGHAIENCAGYGAYLHGEAVAIGMVYAARLSQRLKGFSPADSERLTKLLVKLNLPVDVSGLTWERVRAAMAVDKKTVGGLPKFILSDRMGHVEFGCEVPEELLEEIWNDITPQA